jgi:uncharacterized integral membrane protein
VRLPNRSSEQGVYAMIAAAALVVIYLVAFVVSNATSVRVSFVVFDARASLIIVMLVCVLLGIVLGVLAARLAAQRRQRGSSVGNADTDS